MKNSKRRKIRGLEEWKIGKGNGELQERDTRQKLSGMTEGQTRHRIAIQPTVVRNDYTTVIMPECSCRASRSLGFTLVELVIVIAIVIVLSVVSVPIYRNYVDKAKYAEGYALVGTILAAQKAYYSEYGHFCASNSTDYDPILGIDIRGNKYFKVFWVHCSVDSENYYFNTAAPKPLELQEPGKKWIYLTYNLTLGPEMKEWSQN